MIGEKLESAKKQVENSCIPDDRHVLDPNFNPDQAILTRIGRIEQEITELCQYLNTTFIGIQKEIEKFRGEIGF